MDCRIHTATEKDTDSFHMCLVRCPMQWSQPISVPDARMGAPLEKNLDGFGVSPL